MNKINQIISCYLVDERAKKIYKINTANLKKNVRNQR